MAMTEKQQENYKYFTSQLPVFLNDGLLKNKFLVIKDKQVIRAFDTFERAIEFAVANFPENDFVIQQAIDESEKINFIYCVR